MKSLLSRSLLLLAFAAFVVTLLDVASGLSLLSSGATAFLAVACLVLLFFLARSTSVRRQPIPFVLLFGCLLALGTRLGGFEAVSRRSAAEWAGFQSQRGELVATSVVERFADLSHRAQLAAKRLADEPSIRQVIAQPDNREALAAAFDLFERTPIPAPLAEAVPGVVLYDQWFAPLAWSGNTVDLRSYFDALEESPRSETTVFEQGVFTHLIVIESIDDGNGTLAIQIPLSARRGIDNRYLRDFEVAAAWSGNSVSTDYVDVREPAPELATLFERNQDRYWGGTEEAPMLYFPLRSPAGDLLAVVQLNVEDPATALLETKRTTQQVAGLFLSLAALFAVVWLAAHLRIAGQGFASPIVFVVALWGFRLVVSLAELPLGLFLGLDNPASYASGALFGLLRSPADFFLTALMISLTAATLTWSIVSKETRLRRTVTCLTLLTGLTRRTGPVGLGPFCCRSSHASRLRRSSSSRCGSSATAGPTRTSALRHSRPRSSRCSPSRRADGAGGALVVGGPHHGVVGGGHGIALGRFAARSIVSLAGSLLGDGHSCTYLRLLPFRRRRARYPSPSRTACVDCIRYVGFCSSTSLRRIAAGGRLYQIRHHLPDVGRSRALLFPSGGLLRKVGRAIVPRADGGSRCHPPRRLPALCAAGDAQSD